MRTCADSGPHAFAEGEDFWGGKGFMRGSEGGMGHRGVWEE